MKRAFCNDEFLISCGSDCINLDCLFTCGVEKMFGKISQSSACVIDTILYQLLPLQRIAYTASLPLLELMCRNYVSG